MHAQLVRPDRFGEPRDAIQDEVIDVPELGPHDVLVRSMAAGVNFNNVWAARGVPVDVTKTQARWGEPTDFHIVGSDASRHRVRDRRARSRTSRSATTWSCTPASGTRTTRGWRRARTPASPARSGSGATTRAGARSRSSRRSRTTSACRRPTTSRGRRPRPRRSPAARPTGCSSAGRRTRSQPGDVVLVWGGAGGLGSLAIQLVANAGGRAVAVVSSEEKGEYCKGLGAVGLRRTGRTSTTGACRRRGTRRTGRAGSTARRRSARRSGTRSARRRARGSCSSIPARTRSRRRTSSATAAAWS